MKNIKEVRGDAGGLPLLIIEKTYITFLSDPFLGRVLLRSPSSIIPKIVF